MLRLLLLLSVIHRLLATITYPRMVQDHTVLPMIFFGNWYWTSSFLKRPCSDMDDEDGKKCCSNDAHNGVHGWVHLDAEGRLYKHGSDKPPKFQLLLVDGRISSGLIPGICMNMCVFICACECACTLDWCFSMKTYLR